MTPQDVHLDPDYRAAATDDYEDALFYEDLNRRYECYSGPLRFSEYVERAEAERDAIELGIEGPLPHQDLIDAYWSDDDADEDVL